MNKSNLASLWKTKMPPIEWKLLVFLVLVMDVKLVVKLAALVFAFILQPDFKFGFRWRDTRLPLFYPMIMVIGVLGFFINGQFSAAYSFTVGMGILFWLACLLACHQVKLFAERTPVEILHNTLQLFFLLNIAVSLGNVLLILLEIGLRNPFLYQGQYQKYFMNTGDYIKGISFDTSTTNALINCFGIVYFLYRKKYVMVLACMAILLLTASNFSNVMIVLLFAALFLLRSTRDQKTVMAICMVMLAVFLTKLSPQNESYVTDTIAKFFLQRKINMHPTASIIPIRERPDSLLTTQTRKEKIATLFLDSLERTHHSNSIIHKAVTDKISLPTDSIHTATFQWKRDTTAFQQKLMTYLQTNQARPGLDYHVKAIGKMLSWKQSLQYIQQHPARLLIGAGVANFSSKLAFRATGLELAGTYPSKFIYCNNVFLNNHLSLFTYFLLKHADSHSIIHSPASVYDQLFTEYGLPGLLAFALLYAGYFLRKWKKLSYGIPLLGLMLAFFMVDYWFEQLSVVILFECMMFADVHTN